MSGVSTTVPSRRRRLGTVTLIFGAVFAAYWPALRGGWVWDDDAHVTKAALQSWHGLWRLWFELGATQQYYPVLHSAFWLEHRLWGDAPMGYHLVNVLWHATSACLFGLILRRWTVPGAWLAALIFALHPVCVESVAWISEQKNTLSTVFYLLAALAYLRFDDQRTVERVVPNAPVRPAASPSALGTTRSTQGPALCSYVLATALFAVALLTKTVTATLPAALLVVLWWRHGRLSWRRDVVPLIPWLGLGVAAGLFSAWVERTYIGAQGAAFALTSVQRCILAGRAVWFYLGKLLWPADLIFIYPRWRMDAAAGWQVLFPLGVLALMGALWRVRRRARAPLAALLFFVGSLFPVLGFFNVYPFVFSYVADHFQYLASLGVIALVSAWFCRLAAGPPSPAGRGLRRTSKQITAVAVICLLGVLTWRQCRMYRDAEMLYRATLERNPSAWLAHLNLGNIRWEAGAADEAIGHYEAALRFNPDYADTHFDLGKALMQQGRSAEAANQFSEVLRINPGDAEARNNLGIELANLGRMPEAAAQFEESLRLRPDDAKAHNNLGVALRALGREAEAEAQFARAAQLGVGR